MVVCDRRFARSPTALLLGALLAPLPCLAQEADVREERDDQDVGERPHSTRHDRYDDARELASGLDLLDGPLDVDWTALRDGLAELGIESGLYWTLDSSWVATGGLEPDSTAARNLLDYEVAVDASRLGLEGGELFLSFQAIHGEDGSADVGVLQPVSSVDSEERVQIARVWYQQTIARAWVRAGKMDANSLFAFTEGGAAFMHSSMGYSPTILGLPTYPDPAFGLALGGDTERGVGLRLGVFDGAAQEGVPTGSRGPSTLFGAPADLFLIGEVNVAWGATRTGNLALGGWQHTGTFARFDGGAEDGTAGAYLVLDQRLRSGNAQGARALDAFLQLGSADADVSVFETHVGAGLVWDRPFSVRAVDKLGVGASLALLSDAPGVGLDAGEELAFESFYGFDPLPWVRLQPTVQYVLNPGGDTSLDDALVLSLRASLSL